ncbi:hypothetical protein [Erwinia sorbitola]|uniref:Uncharacterized protein n=1 Tax=Erwinia sorbitola TaxID=2681984 RepID=A0A6I6EPR7_9GAMM|nr:hypothetical protein [Erwinia sorbitola]QGU87059.1 hypothetical protein GN242_07445 [Erwinia sorbitola]
MKIKTSDIMVCRELSVDGDWVARMAYYSEEKSLLMSKKIIDMFLTEVKMLHKHRHIRAGQPARGGE